MHSLNVSQSLAQLRSVVICLVAALLWLGTTVTTRAQTVIPGDVLCSECQIRAVADADIGTATGPGSLPQNYRVAIDQRGRFWVLPIADVPMVFDAQGRFVRTVGRVGSGPGEVQRPIGIVLLPADSVGLVELGGRIHVYDAALQFKRTVTMPVNVPSEVHVLSWPDTVLVHSEINTPERVGLPFHLVDLSAPTPQIIASYGSADGKKLPRSLARHTTAASGKMGQYWTAPVGLYQVTKWAGTTPLLSIMRRPDWFAGESDGSPGGPDRPPSPRLIGLREDESGLLWVYLLQPSADYRKAFARVEDRLRNQPRSEVRSGEIDREYLYNTVVEVIDPNGMNLIARHGLNRPTSILSDGRLAVELSSPEGVPFVRVIRLQLLRE